MSGCSVYMCVCVCREREGECHGVTNNEASKATRSKQNLFSLAATLGHTLVVCKACLSVCHVSRLKVPSSDRVLFGGSQRTKKSKSRPRRRRPSGFFAFSSCFAVAVSCCGYSILLLIILHLLVRHCDLQYSSSTVLDLYFSLSLLYSFSVQKTLF